MGSSAYLQSMTGFGRGESTDSRRSVTVEIKSVNHRFLDVRFKSPSFFRALEIPFKKQLAETFRRGSFDVYINYKEIDKESLPAAIDIKAVDALLAKISPILEEREIPLQMRPTDFLCSEFMVKRDLSQDQELMSLASAALEGAISELLSDRKSEGEKLSQIVAAHLDHYRRHLNVVEAGASQLEKAIESNIRGRLERLSEIEINEPRVMQEIIFYLEKLDISEEIGRIKSHLGKMEKLLSAGGEVGRQIDFTVQELNRETNTIGSKSGAEEISDCIINMKVQLEKIREQGLNLE